MFIGKLQVGVDFEHRLRGIVPNLILNASLLGDNIYVFKTEMGYYAYMPVDTTGEIEDATDHLKTVDFYNLETVGEAINKFMAAVGKTLKTGEWQPQYPKFSAIPVPSLRWRPTTAAWTP